MVKISRLDIQIFKRLQGSTLVQEEEHCLQAFNDVYSPSSGTRNINWWFQTQRWSYLAQKYFNNKINVLEEWVASPSYILHIHSLKPKLFLIIDYLKSPWAWFPRWSRAWWSLSRRTWWGSWTRSRGRRGAASRCRTGAPEVGYFGQSRAANEP